MTAEHIDVHNNQEQQRATPLHITQRLGEIPLELTSTVVETHTPPQKRAGIQQEGIKTPPVSWQSRLTAIRERFDAQKVGGTLPQEKIAECNQAMLEGVRGALFENLSYLGLNESELEQAEVLFGERPAYTPGVEPVGVNLVRHRLNTMLEPEYGILEGTFSHSERLLGTARTLLGRHETQRPDILSREIKRYSIAHQGRAQFDILVGFTSIFEGMSRVKLEESTARQQKALSNRRRKVHTPSKRRDTQRPTLSPSIPSVSVTPSSIEKDLSLPTNWHELVKSSTSLSFPMLRRQYDSLVDAISLENSDKAHLGRHIFGRKSMPSKTAQVQPILADMQDHYSVGKATIPLLAQLIGADNRIDIVYGAFLEGDRPRAIRSTHPELQQYAELTDEKIVQILLGTTALAYEVPDERYIRNARV